MGLNTTHGAWDGPYSSFGEFRKNLAKEIGINLEEMQGFSKDGKPGEIPWKTVKHKIKSLLNHSDCDGHLTPRQCKTVAEGLKEIIEKLPDYGLKGTFDYKYSTKGRAETFRSGCLKAYNKNEYLKFH